MNVKSEIKDILATHTDSKFKAESQTSGGQSVHLE